MEGMDLVENCKFVIVIKNLAHFPVIGMYAFMYSLCCTKSQVVNCSLLAIDHNYN